MVTYRFIRAERARKSWPVAVMCCVLAVGCSAFYAWAVDPESRTRRGAKLPVHIRSIHRKSGGTYGIPRIHAALKEEGLYVARKRVARLMREEGLCGAPSKKTYRVPTTLSDHDNPIAKNLLQRKFTTERPNQAWVGDITYLRTGPRSSFRPAGSLLA
ncbi:MAG: transposase InsO family protein [Myxococcota bacterium]